MQKAGLVTGLLVAIFLFILPAPSNDQIVRQQPGASEMIRPESLAERILEGNEAYLLLDVRSRDSFARNGIKTAISAPVEDLNEEMITRFPMYRPIIVYAASTIGAVEAWQKLHQYRENVYVLDGGLAEWDSLILRPGVPVENASEDEWNQYNKNLAVANFFLGKTDVKPVEFNRTVEPMLRPRTPLIVDEGC